MGERDFPLRALAANSAQCTEVSLSVTPPLTRKVARADRDSVKVLWDMMGVELPTVPCLSNQCHDRVALWLGPDEWLVLADEGVELPAAYPGG
ncbi:MAG: hypothetical protein WAL10_18155, partial [Acetobacteraceae bacterium]